MTRLTLTLLLLAACGSGTAPSNGNTEGTVLTADAPCVQVDGGGVSAAIPTSLNWTPESGEAIFPTICGPWLDADGGVCGYPQGCLTIGIDPAAPADKFQPAENRVGCSIGGCIATRVVFQVLR